MFIKLLTEHFSNGETQSLEKSRVDLVVINDSALLGLN